MGLRKGGENGDISMPQNQFVLLQALNNCASMLIDHKKKAN